VLWIAPLHAQEPTGTIRGRVTDATTQQPVAGATVSIGARRALSEADGRYVISGVPAGTDSLHARLIGYGRAVQSVTIAGGDTLVVDLAMTPQAVSLSEVVVTGYGTQQAGNYTGAAAHVNSDQFNPGRVYSPEQLIQDKVAGVQVVDNNEPGGGLSVRIRGATSVNASSDPLYVIDGMPVGTGTGGGFSAGRNPLNFLDPNDIESITVLKDASAAAIYGANAANGVVMITTKRGRGGPQIEYSASASASSVTRLPSMLNAAQFQAAVTQYAPQNLPQLGNTNTDWFSLVDHTAFGQQHDVTISGAGQSNNYRLSVGYLNQDGIIKATNLQRVSLGINYDQRLLDDRLSLRASLKGSREFDQFTPGTVLYNAAQMGPTQPVYDPTSVTGFYNWPGNKLTSADNPLEALTLAQAQGTTYRSVGNVQAEYSLPFLQGLKANINLGYDVAKVSQQTFNPAVLHSETKNGENGLDYQAQPSQLNSVLETYLDYAAPLNVLPGNIDLTAGYSYSQSHAETPSFTATGLSTDLLTINGIPAAQNVSNFLDVEESKLISFFGRATWNWNDRYLAAFSIRRDGSSRFGSNNAWGMFPSLSLGWRISQEPFMQGWTWLSDLKLRAAYGKTGNQAFANYQQYTSYLASNTQAQVQFGNQFIPTIRPGAVDPNIKWEETNSYDIGLDYGILNHRVSGSIDWYTKKTTDLIFTVPVAAGTNFSNFLTTNIGSMRNTGVEFGVDARILEGGSDRLSWNTGWTASHNTNRLLTINPVVGAVQQILVGGVAGGVGTTIQVLEPGVPINSFFVCQQAYSNGKPVENNYVQANGTIVTGCANTDRRAFHDPAPHWILGHTSYLTYGKFDLSFTLRAYLGNYVYNNVASNLGTYQELSRSSPYNLQTSVLTTGFMSPQYLSDYYVENASFLRMDNISAGYTFTYRGQQVRVYGIVQSAFTITGYSGVDPTAGLLGIDNNIYPRSRTITGGLSVRF
jgi:iron complex outermembrane receptor protein